MSRNNKNFIIGMIATAVVGLVILMIVMFVGVKYYIGKTGNAGAVQDSSLKQEEKAPEVEYSSTILAVVTEITADEIKGFDIENRQSVVKPVNPATKIGDAYNKTIPLSSIKKGDVVEIVYEEDKDRTLSINKSSQAWTKNKVNGVKVNVEASEIELFGSVYTYDSDIIVLDSKGMETEINNIKPCDIVTVQGIKGRVVSIRVEEMAGSIQFLDIPSREGRVELDINTMIPLANITAPIDVVPGKHKVSVNIKGYESFIQEVEIGSGEVYKMSLDSAKRAYTSVKVAITNVDVENYNVKIDNQTYAKGEAISIPQGTYNVTITAENYLPWVKRITFEKGIYNLKATLQSKKTEETPTSTPVATPGTEKNNQTATGETRTINIASDPSGAKVYINGVSRGTTPYKVTLAEGSYSILLEKDGYEVYSTSIILDGSDDQNGFLYVLTPKS